MGARQGSDDRLVQILRLSSDFDPASLQLSAEEGFLLSRVDGNTPWRLLREIGGLPAEEADICLESWLACGVLTLGAKAAKAARRTPSKRVAHPAAATARLANEAKRTLRAIDESQLDASLEVDLDVQRRILSFEANLERPYHELLGVAPDVDSREVKRAYFKLSKEFHPDRYFRREIGGYVARLERIFKKVLEAYEILSDPELRAELQNAGAVQVFQQQAVSNDGAPDDQVASDASAKSAAPPRVQSRLERLKQRMPFRISNEAVEERRRRASEFERAAVLSGRRERWSEAAASMRIAICFDPYNAEYKAQMADFQARAADQRAADLLDPSRSQGEMDHHDLEKALRMLEDVLLYRPHDPALNQRAAALALELDRPDRALGYVQTALEHEPEDASLHSLLGRIRLANREMGHARKAFETAIKLDPNDVEARKKLASLRLGKRSVA